jgi:hypothetical protein
MSKDELESALSERLRPEGGDGGQETFSSKLSTTWGEQRIIMGTSGGYGAFDLAKGHLYKITFTAADGWEEKLLKALFERLGNARHVRGMLYRDGSGELVTLPIARTTPRAVGGGIEPERHTYQWMDKDTEVLVSDGYSYNSSSGKSERFVSVTLKGWRVAAQNATEEYSANSTTFSERQIEMDAQEYFNWRKSQDSKKEEQPAPKEKSKDSSI